MDLTQQYPAQVRAKIHGIVQLQRAIDKGKALVHGNVSDYNFNSPMDVAVFEFLGISEEALLDVIRHAQSDKAISDYVRTFIHRKTQAEIDAWNEQWLTTPPEPGSYAATLFAELHATICPDRPDIKTFPDLIDWDESRPMAKAAPADAKAAPADVKAAATLI